MDSFNIIAVHQTPNPLNSMPNSTPGIAILNELYDKFDITIKLQILRRF